MTKHLTLTSVLLTTMLSSALAHGQTAPDFRWDAAAAATYLDERQTWWMGWEPAQREQETFCISCHTAVPYALSRSTLRAGLGETASAPPQKALVENVRRRVRLWAEVAPERVEAKGSEAVLNSLVLASHDAGAARLSDDTRRAFEHLWEMQLDDGDRTGAWPWIHADLEPWEEDGGPYYGAALAAIAVGMAPEGYADEAPHARHVARLRRYLADHHADQNLFNQLTALWAATRLPGVLDPAGQTVVIEEALARQQDDGGWSLSSLGPYTLRDGSPRVTKSDGYATGMIAFVLLQAGVGIDHPGLQRALSWLATNQDPVDGSWFAPSLNKHRDPASDTGRFMRDAATAYAVLALTRVRHSAH